MQRLAFLLIFIAAAFCGPDGRRAALAADVDRVGTVGEQPAGPCDRLGGVADDRILVQRVGGGVEHAVQLHGCRIYGGGR